jgi:hypothetical protein
LTHSVSLLKLPLESTKANTGAAPPCALAYSSMTPIALPVRVYPNLYGIWQVDGFSVGGYRRDPLLTDELRWRRVVFDRPFLISDPVMVIVQHSR